MESDRTMSDTYIADLETALAEARGIGPARSPAHRKADEEIVIYHLGKRDGTPKRDRLTPRMEARQIIDALDVARATRYAARVIDDPDAR